MPNSLEFPRMRRAIVPLMRARNAVVGELVAGRLPSLAAIVRTLDQLSVPACGLGYVQPVGVDGRCLQMVNLPAAEVRPADVLLVARSIGTKNKRSLFRA